MSEEKIYDAPETMDVPETEETLDAEVVETEATEETVETEEVVETQTTEPVAAKKGFATAALVFGILAFITTVLVINYVFGILALVFGIIYLAKKADIKPKGKAIAGVVLASLSIIISTVLWVNVYNYVANTKITDIITDVGVLIGEEIDGEALVNQTVSDMTGGAMDLATIEEFVGGEVTVERIAKFVGDVKEEEITSFISEVETMDQETLGQIVQELGGEVTYEKLEEKLGKDFSLKELMDYIRNFEKNQ